MGWFSKGSSKEATLDALCVTSPLACVIAGLGFQLAPSAL
ncbi:MAG: hypothetical protein OJF50_006412 [Nitrospira sp.]|nr:hypothetical protein [Nitrospira sp.]